MATLLLNEPYCKPTFTITIPGILVYYAVYCTFAPCTGTVPQRELRGNSVTSLIYIAHMAMEVWSLYYRAPNQSYFVCHHTARPDILHRCGHVAQPRRGTFHCDLSPRKWRTQQAVERLTSGSVRKMPRKESCRLCLISLPPTLRINRSELTI
jgi:hypothetical protein